MHNYGKAVNGQGVGSGYDCEVARISDETAAVYLSRVGRYGADSAWIWAQGVEPDADMDRLAREIASAGASWIDGGDAWRPQDEDWDEACNSHDAAVRYAQLADEVATAEADLKLAINWFSYA